jgi:hypothetical protein
LGVKEPEVVDRGINGAVISANVAQRGGIHRTDVAAEPFEVFGAGQSEPVVAV